MIDWAGPVPSVSVTCLAAVLLAPSVGCALVAVALRRAPSRRRAIASTVVALAGCAASLAAVALTFARLPSVTSIASLARFGQLDLNVDFVVSPGAALLAAAVFAALALASFARRKTDDGPARANASHACLALGGLGGVIAIAADPLPLVAMGFALTSFAVAACTRRPRRALAFGGAAIAFLLGSAGTLFWGSAGGWSPEGYTAALAPRFVSVRSSSDEPLPLRRPSDDDDDDDFEAPLDPSETPPALLTFTAMPGATLFVDDARTPLSRGDSPVVAPFSNVPVPAGRHAFRVHPGAGADDYWVPAVSLVGGRATEIVDAGATLSLRTIATQLAVVENDHAFPLREALAARSTWAGLGVPGLVVGLLVLACAMKILEAAALARVPAMDALALGACIVAPVVRIVLDSSALFAITPRAAVVVASALAAAVMVGGTLWARGRRLGDDAPSAVIGPSLARLAGLVASLDTWVVDSFARAALALPRLVAWVLARFDEGAVDARGARAAIRVERAIDTPGLSFALVRVRLVCVIALALTLASLLFAALHR